MNNAVFTNLNTMLQTVKGDIATIAFTIAGIMGIYAIMLLMMGAHQTPNERSDNRKLLIRVFICIALLGGLGGLIAFFTGAGAAVTA